MLFVALNNVDAYLSIDFSEMACCPEDIILGN